MSSISTPVENWSLEKQFNQEIFWGVSADSIKTCPFCGLQFSPENQLQERAHHQSRARACQRRCFKFVMWHGQCMTSLHNDSYGRSGVRENRGYRYIILMYREFDICRKMYIYILRIQYMFGHSRRWIRISSLLPTVLTLKDVRNRHWCIYSVT